MIGPLKLALWFSGAGLQAVIGGVMLRRKLYREFPLFFAFIFCQVIRFLVLFGAYQAGNRESYRQAFLVLEAVDALLSFAVIYELYAHTFRAYEGIRELGWVLLRWASAVLLIVAVVAAASSSGSDSDRFLAGLFALEQSISIVRGGLLFLLFLFHAALGLRWGRHAFGIALGLGLLTSIALAAFTLRAHFGALSTSTLSLITSAAYNCAVIVWLVAVLRPAAERIALPRVPRWDLDGWNRTLLELMQR
jgi:hypothetical protein